MDLAKSVGSAILTKVYQVIFLKLGRGSQPALPFSVAPAAGLPLLPGEELWWWRGGDAAHHLRLERGGRGAAAGLQVGVVVGVGVVGVRGAGRPHVVVVLLVQLNLEKKRRKRD